MFPFHPTGGPGDGLFPMTRVVNATNRTGATALAVGEGVQFDLALGTDVDNLTPGSTDADDLDNNSAWNNVIAPNASSILGHTIVAIWGFNAGKAAVADNALAEICYFGFGDILQIMGSGDTAVGTDMTIDANGAFDGVPITDEVIIAFSREVLTAPTAATLGKGFLFGHWFGKTPLTAFFDA